ncbi:hypothetical protein R6Q59_000449 [Mikania micrantha]
MAVDCIGVQTVDHLNRIFQLSTHDFNVSSSYTQAPRRKRFPTVNSFFVRYRSSGTDVLVEKPPLPSTHRKRCIADRPVASVHGSRRVYYKCITGKGCPARKRVEFASKDSKMLLVTYDGEHRHRHRHAPTPVPMSLTGVLSSQSEGHVALHYFLWSTRV